MVIDHYVEAALDEFEQGFSCAEAVFIGGAKALGMTSDLIPKLATGFGGGVSRTKSVCGAVTGAVLVLSAKYGRTVPADDRTVLMGKVQALVADFRERFKSENCYDLTGLDFNTPDGQAEYKLRVHGLCRSYVEFCVRRVLELCEVAE